MYFAVTYETLCPEVRGTAVLLKPLHMKPCAHSGKMLRTLKVSRVGPLWPRS